MRARNGDSDADVQNNTAGPEQDGTVTESAPKEKKPKKHRVPGFVGTDWMAELVVDGTRLMRFSVNNSPALRSQIKNGKDILVPPYGLKSFIQAGSLHLPSKAERNITAAQLISEIEVFLYWWTDTPDEWREPIAYFVLMTWVFDRFSAVPYLRFLGEWGTGKTRLLLAVAVLCYRSFTVSGNITGAALFRSIDLIRGTVAVDEADFKNSAEWNDVIKVLNSGYTPGLPIIRLDGDSGAFSPRSFCVYGPKVISTRHRFDDPALESRCLTFETQERKVDSRIPLQLPQEFYVEAQELRNKLLGWRFDNFFSVQADDSMLRQLDNRLAQIGASLVAVAPNKKAVVSFLNDYGKSSKEDSPKEIVRQILAEMRGKGSIADATQKANQGLQGSGASLLTCKAVGSIVRSLGYQTRRTKTGYVIGKG